MLDEDAREPDLAQVRVAVKRRCDLGVQKRDLEERLKRINTEVNELDHRVLPQLFAEAGVSIIGVPADGNTPAFEARLADFYRAVIPANWDDVKRDAAFEVLERLGLKAIIKNVVTVTFARDEFDDASELVSELEARGVPAILARTVHHMTLTSAVKELCEVGRRPSPGELQAIGAFVGKIVKIDEEKED